MISCKCDCPIRRYLQTGVMCNQSSETHDHLFLHCESGRFLWNSLFQVLGEAWLNLLSISSFMYPRGFGRDKDSSRMWQCGVFDILWIIWIVRSGRIFRSDFYLGPFFGIELFIWLRCGLQLPVFLVVCLFQNFNEIGQPSFLILLVTLVFFS